MKTLLLISTLTLSLAVTNCLHAQTTSTDSTATTRSSAKAWPKPERFEKDISAFENTTAPVSQGAVIAYGSSSIRGWHKTIAEDLAPLTIVPRGFGGSNMNDALHFMDRVIIPLKPRAVLLYEGDNDVAGGYPIDAMITKYQQFIQRLHSALPQSRVYILSIKPSPLRWKFWPAAQEANKQLQQIAELDPLVTYIDVATPMLKADGTPKEDIFLSDRLHMNRKGYEIWRDAILPVLMQHEAAHQNGK